jgi:hypothetical protein
MTLTEASFPSLSREDNMAGLGWKTWSTGDTVSAANFQGYLQDQVIAVFATTSARDTAISSPSDGQFAYVTASTGTLYVYDNSAWTAIDLAGDIQGIVTAAASGLSGGTTSGTATLTLNLAGLTAAQAFGADGAGVDVTFHSGTAGDYLMWDASEEKLILEGTNGATALDVTDGNVVIGDGTLTIGSDGAGEDVTFHSDTAGDYMQWDSSEEKLILEGTNGATVLDVTDGNVVIGDGTLTVGSDGAGEDVTFYSDTAGDSMVWDSSAEKLTITGTNGQTALDVADGDVTITDSLSGDYTIHTFNSSGTFQITSGSGDVEWLIVAGGGGATTYLGSGAGGGGMRTGTETGAGAGSYSVVVGGGGSGKSGDFGVLPTQGGTSSNGFGQSATGGGRGANVNSPNYTTAGGSGGAGGGAAYDWYPYSYGPAGSGNAGSYSPSEGADGGGNVNTGSYGVYGGGGGGGGGASGQTPTQAAGPYSGGIGGNGTASSISGASVTYAGGGGGGADGNGPQNVSGGSGGGGNGGTGSPSFPAGSGTANTGGGGGGSGAASAYGGSGGSGIVILRYLTAG